MTKYYDYDTAKLALFRFIEGWYNRRRIHLNILKFGIRERGLNSYINYMISEQC